MTAKRFYVDYKYGSGDLWDRRTGLLLQDFGKHIASECTLVVDMLNNLNEENKSLKEENKFLRNKVATYKKGNALLKSTMDKEWK